MPCATWPPARPGPRSASEWWPASTTTSPIWSISDRRHLCPPRRARRRLPRRRIQPRRPQRRRLPPVCSAEKSDQQDRRHASSLQWRAKGGRASLRRWILSCGRRVRPWGRRPSPTKPCPSPRSRVRPRRAGRRRRDRTTDGQAWSCRRPPRNRNRRRPVPGQRPPPVCLNWTPAAARQRRRPSPFSPCRATGEAGRARRRARLRRTTGPSRRRRRHP